MNRIMRNTGFYLIIFLVTVGVFNYISGQGDSTKPLRYDEFRQVVEAGNVASITAKYNIRTGQRVRRTIISPPK